jgi:hypothetical protein
MAAMTDGGLAQASVVSRSLLDLRRTVEDLDPGRQGDLLSPRKLLGLIPFGDRLRDYFDRYRRARASSTPSSGALLRAGQLVRDNGRSGRKANLWAVGPPAPVRLSARSSTPPSGGSRNRGHGPRAGGSCARACSSVPGSRTCSSAGVSVQGYLARSLAGTSAHQGRRSRHHRRCRPAHSDAWQALSDQKLVLDQITALNATTGDLIESTSRLLRDQSGKIGEQAASATIDLAKLQAAFANIYATMDEIDTFKVRALDTMAQTVKALSAEVAKSQAYLDRVRQSENNAALGGTAQRSSSSPSLDRRLVARPGGRAASRSRRSIRRFVGCRHQDRTPLETGP